MSFMSFFHTLGYSSAGLSLLSQSVDDNKKPECRVKKTEIGRGVSVETLIHEI